MSTGRAAQFGLGWGLPTHFQTQTVNGRLVYQFDKYEHLGAYRSIGFDQDIVVEGTRAAQYPSEWDLHMNQVSGRLVYHFDKYEHLGAYRSIGSTQGQGFEGTQVAQYPSEWDLHRNQVSGRLVYHLATK